MRLKITTGKFAVCCILNTMLVLILTSSFAGFLNYKMDLRFAAAAAVSVNIVLYVLYLYPIADIAAAAIAVIFAAAYCFMLHQGTVNTFTNAGAYVDNAYHWFMQYMFTNIDIELGFANLVMMAYTAVLSAILFLLVIVRRNAVIPMLIGIILISAMWYYGYDNAYGAMQKYLIIGFILFGFINYERRENSWRLKHDKYSKNIVISWVVYSCAAALLAFFIANIIPGDINPVSIQWVNENIFDRVDSIGPNQSNQQLSANKLKGRFNISSLGFQQSPTRLGGSVQLTNRLLLKVKVDGIEEGPFYLRGTVRDDYNGSCWKESTGSVASIKSGQAIGNISGGTGSINKNVNVTVTVKPQGLNTTSIFNLWQPCSIDSGGAGANCNEDGELYFSKSRGQKEYKVISKVPVVYADELEKASKTSVSFDSAKYMGVPDTVPQRVIELAAQITEKYNNNYDKAIAIQDYLRANYPYTLKTSSLPDGRDFVDYFLFDEKEGYCTYFATAMAIMCRIVGIPSRYVEGFILDSPQRDTNGYYSVYSMKAHSWVELYFDGYGWLNFEPTPGYSAIDYDRPKTDSTGGESGSTGTSTAVPTPGSKNPGGRQKNIDDEDAGTVSARKSIPYKLLAGILILIVLFARIGYKIYSSIKGIRKADSMTGKDAAMEYMKLLERGLHLGGEGREPGETPAEFGERASKYLKGYGIDIRDLMTRFDLVRFGNLPIDNSIRKKFKSAIKKTDRIIKDRQGIFKYLLIKYLL